MKVYLYINSNLMDILNRMIKNPLHEFDTLRVYHEPVNPSQIMISLDYDTFILLQDNKLINFIV
jgi:hypothetical protein